MLKDYTNNHRISGKMLVHILIGLVVLVIAFLAIDNTILKDKPEVTTENAIQPTVEAPEKSNRPVAEEKDTVLHNSVAVMPFENLSPDPDDAYFAIGIHQEILDHLAMIRDIQSISRASVLHYENTDISVAEIASELNVGTIMKGSVRYEENKITLAVRLYNAASLSQLWSERYESELSDIFMIQADIVDHIVQALGATLTAAEKEHIHKVPTRSFEAYVLYLRTKIIPSIIGENKPDIFYQLLDKSIEQDPEFALAHAYKARGYELARRSYRPVNGLTLDEMGRVALEQVKIALALDPNLGMAYLALAEIHRGNQDKSEARHAYDQAVQLSPGNKDILNAYARFLSIIKEHGDAIRLGQRVLDLDPNDANNYYLQGWTLMDAGNVVAAAKNFRLGNAIEPNFFRNINLALAEIALGNKAEALTALRDADKLIDKTITIRGVARVAYAYSNLGLQEDAKRLFDLIQTKITNGEPISTSYSALAYLSIGEVEKARTMLNHDPYDAFDSLYYIKPNVENSLDRK